MDIWGLMEGAARRHGSRTCIRDGDASLDYARVRRRCLALAAWMRGQGLAPGDRLAVLEPNSAAFIESYLGAAAAGVVLCPVNHRLAAAEVSRVLDDAGVRAVISAPELADLAREAAAARPVLPGGDAYEDVVESGDAMEPHDVRPDDLAHLYYTSGTTGEPKGVMLTHRNVCVHALNAVSELRITGRDVWAHIAPMFHLADAWATFAITHVGGVHVCARRFDAGEALALMVREGVTITNLVPTMLNLMVKHPDAAGMRFPSLRLVMSGGAPIAPDLVGRIVRTFGCEYVQTYGMTETSPYLTLSVLDPDMDGLPDEERLRYRARTGRPFRGIDLRVVDDRGEDVPRDDATVGEIRVRGESVTPGYWGKPGETARAFEDGWLLTGDLAVMDARGWIDIVDRKKDVILTGGENVYSTEVENAIYEHPDVLEAAAFGLPDETWGEVVCAAVVPRPGRSIDPEALQRHVRDRIASYKVPRRVILMDALPRTGSGKIAKRLLRRLHG